VVARSKEPLQKLEKEYPEQVKPLAGDLADFSLGKKAVDLAKNTWDRLDGLIVNHGVLNPMKRITDVDAEDWRRCFDINVFSAVALIKEALPALCRTQGKIVLVSSGAAVGAYATWGAYGASKAVLNHLALTLAVEEPEVTTLSIRPGIVDTEMQRELREIHHTTMDKKDVEKFASLKSEGKLLRPDQPGHVIAKLALDGPKDLNGQFLV
jgi:NAD(P)-dependent dehydrogenase (short-subunit alcohol dehydrogenase family)